MSERSKPPEPSPKSKIPLASWLASESGQGELEGEDTPESEAADEQLRRKQQWAAIRHKDAATESLRIQSRNSRAKVDADIDNRKAWTRANIADRKRRTEVEMSGLERRDRTTQVERYFWMAVAALGLLATIVLALVTAGHSAWEYRVSPVAGLLLVGGGGFQLWSITRSQPDDEGRDAQRLS